MAPTVRRIDTLRLLVSLREEGVPKGERIALAEQHRLGAEGADSMERDPEAELWVDVPVEDILEVTAEAVMAEEPTSCLELLEL